MSADSLFDNPPSDWEVITLGAVCARGGGNVQTGPFGSQLHASDYVPRGIPSIMPQNLAEDRISTEGIAYIREEDAQRLSRYLVRSGDIVYSRRGDVTRRALVGEEHNGWLCGTGCLRIRFGNDQINPRFAFYYLGHPLVKEWISRHAIGATLPNLNTSILSALPFLVPSSNEQAAIADILGVLDDKIELNRQMNETLEAMARALFKSWFIDFDPVRAKAEGRQPFGMDAETAAIFPDSFQDSPLGKIPRGWRVGKLSELCTTQYGYTASATEEPVGPKLLRVTDINKRNWIEWDSVPHCQIGEDDKSKYSLAVGDVVVARMADPGKSAIIEEPVDAVFASYLVRLKTPTPAHAYYVYGFLKSLAYEEYSQGVIGGSVQANMNAKVIVGADFVIPPDKLIDAYGARVLPLRRRVVANLRQASTLASIRDALLPKLISGEIRLQGAEKASE